MTFKLTKRERAIAQGLDPDGEEFGAGVYDEEETVAEAESSEAEVPEDEEEEGLEEEPEAEDSEASADDDGDEETWVTDDVQALAKSYGLSDEDLGEFNSAAEFGRFTRLVDKKLSKPADEPDEKKGGKPEADTESEAGKKTEEKKGGDDDPDDIDVQRYIDEGYDEDTLKLVRFAKRQKDEIEQLKQSINPLSDWHKQQQQQQQEMARIQIQNEFHDAVDDLGPDRYGKSLDDNGRVVKLEDESVQRRKKLWDQADVLIRGMIAAGQEVPTMRDVVKRAERLAFPDEAGGSKSKNAEGIKRQSAKRRPASGRKGGGRRQAPSAEAKTPEEAAENIANHPDIVAKWKELEQKNG